MFIPMTSGLYMQFSSMPSRLRMFQLTYVEADAALRMSIVNENDQVT